MERKIIKRTNEVVEYDLKKIEVAVQKATEAAKHESEPINIIHIAEQVDEELEEFYFKVNKIPHIEDIQDMVEKVLNKDGYFNITRAYILYREERNKLRSEKQQHELEQVSKHTLSVTKHDGSKELFDETKLQKVWKQAAGELSEECPFNEVFEVFKLTLTNDINTENIIQNLRKACLDQTSTENTKWQQISGRLLSMEIYKKAARNRNLSVDTIYSAENWLNHFKDYREKKLYSEKFDDAYTDEQIKEAGEWIDPKRDFTYQYSTILAFNKRYLLNPNKKVHELPQEMYIAVALFLAIPEKAEERMAVAKRIYEACSNQKLSLPTPTLLNARTNFHQLSSCFKLNVDDDLRSIYHNMENMAQISKYGGGVGVYLGHVRSKGASIRGVQNASAGVLPWIKVINSTACAVNQLGARLGAISPTLDVWHKDIFDFLEMQTETGDIRQKAFDLFPAVSFPDLFMERVQEGGKWTLFDPHEVEQVTGKRLEDHFNDKFKQFFIECENNDALILKEEVDAKDLMKHYLKTTVETGMPYAFYRDKVNKVNPNKHAGNVYSTQLCTEICQNTSQSKFIEETTEDGDVVLKYNMGDTVVCNLASINIAKVNSDEDINEVIDIGMRVLDNVITLNFYPIKESEFTAKKYRPVGLGFMGLAEYLACNKLQYDSQEARENVDALFEKYAYATLKASNDLSIERGHYELFPGSEWSKGILFGREEDWYKNNAKTDRPWAELISSIKDKGLRFGYHLAPAPNTSTSGVVGTTAGLLPVYKKFFIETNVIAPTVTVAPNLNPENFWFYKEYKNMDMKDVIDMISTVYKWVDQSISFEWMINPAQTSPKDLYDYYMKAWEQDVKTVYYVRSMSADVEDVCSSCSG